MARIIVMGDAKAINEPVKPTVLTGKCQRCGCVFECDEVEATVAHPIGTQKKTTWHRKCAMPGCGTRVTLEKKTAEAKAAEKS